jgi:hypothetical protein
MHKKLIVGAILAALLAVASASLAFAGGGGSRDHDGDNVRTLHVTLTNTHETDFDLGASGPSVGDRFVVFGDVTQNGQRVGAGGYECSTLCSRWAPIRRACRRPSPTSAPPPCRCPAARSPAKGWLTVRAHCQSPWRSPAAPANTAPPTASWRPPDQTKPATSH